MITSVYFFLIIQIIQWSFGSVIHRDNFDLTIVHFNDFHARFEQININSLKCNPEIEKCIGGFPRLFTAIDTIKRDIPDAIVLNAGDVFQGTIWYNILGWNVTQYFMNLLPLDASTIGNHEFDDGINGIAPYLKSLKTPTVLSNVDDSLEPDFQNLYTKSIVIERTGRKIGIIGVIAKETETLSNTENLKFTDEVEAVKIEAQKLVDQGINIIIVLSHCGLDKDREIAKNAGTNIDIIVGGHSHTLLYNGEPPLGTAEDVYPVVVDQPSGSKVLIVQAALHTKYLGNITLSFDSDGKLTSWMGNPIYLDDSIKEDARILELMMPFKEEIDNINKMEVGISKVFLDKSECSRGECNIGNFLNDAFVDYFIDKSEENFWTYSAISIMCQDGIKTNLNKGSIRYEDIVNLLPYGNNIYTFDIKGKYILESLEYSVSSINGTSFTMLQVSGLQIVYNITKPSGQRVEKVLVICAECDVPRYYPLDLETVYTVSSQSYLANGGYGFTSISDNKMNVKIWEKELEILQKSLKRRSPIIASEDNRIIILK